jgi:FecR protein
MKTGLSTRGWICRGWRWVALAGGVAAVFGMGGIAQAKTLGQATVTQVNNDVRYQPATGAERPAKTQDIVKGADTVRTGQKSQAELEFEDHTITRLGSNSTFTFDPEKREFQLKKGLLLFDMPKHAGGGKIITPAGTAAIEGTAGIVSYRSAPKIICLAGVINVVSPGGQLMAQVKPGQLFIVGVTKYPVDFMLSGLKTGKLMQGGLPNNSQEYDSSSNNQQNQIQGGHLQVTQFVMIGEKNDVYVGTPPGTDPITKQLTNPSQDANPGRKTSQTTTASFARIDDDTTMDANTGVLNAKKVDLTITAPTDQPNSVTTSVTDESGVVVYTTTLPSGSTITAATSPQTWQGTVQSGKATFDFGTMDVRVRGNPQIVPDASGVFNAEFDTQGDISFLSLPAGGQTGSSSETSDLLTFKAGTINFVNSTFHIGGGEIGPSSLWLYAAGDLVVDTSSLRVSSGPADEVNPAGLLHLESVGGRTVFAGSGYDPVNDPCDLLRSHATATINEGGGVFDGGAIEIISKGQQTFTVAGVTIPLGGVFIHDATIDVSAKDDCGYMTSGTGGNVFIGAKSYTDDSSLPWGTWGGNMQVVIEDTTEIFADGATPGSIRISSSGNSTVLGRIALNVPNSTGHITLSAQPVSGYSFFADLSGGLTPGDGGSISLLGASGDTYNLWLTTAGPAGGGTITANAYGLYYSRDSWAGGIFNSGGINIQYARLDASAVYGSGLSAGAILLQAPQIAIGYSQITAGDPVSSYLRDGSVGQIKINAVNPNGTYLGTGVAINNSTLTVGGGSAVSLSGIFIAGDTVSIDTASTPYANPAQVHIESRVNTGFSDGVSPWSTDPTASLYWSPLYFFMDNNTTMDNSSTTPLISGPSGTVTGKFVLDSNNNKVAVYDFGSQNILLWLQGPHHPTPDASGFFRSEFYTSGSFEVLDMTPNPGYDGPGVTKTDRVGIHATGIQIVDSIFDMSGSVYGPAGFRLYSSTDLIVTSPDDSVGPPSALIPENGTQNGLNTGGTLHLESAGVTAIGGTDSSRTTEILAGGADIGGTVEIISTGDGTGPGGSTEGVHIRNALIDVTYAVTSDCPITIVPTPATQGGKVIVDGAQQVTIEDNTTIRADGQTAGSIQVTSEGTKYQAGSVSMQVNSSPGTGYIQLSAQDSATVLNALPQGGDIDIIGASGRASGKETVQINATGPNGGGDISIAAIQNLSVINARLNAGNSINLSGQNVLVQNSALIAGNTISINAVSYANILYSYLNAPNINIHATTVDFTGSTLVGNAQVYANNVSHNPASGTYTLHQTSVP